MFIGGLNWDTDDRASPLQFKTLRTCPQLISLSPESLKNYFSQFGEVQECTVMRDGATGRSRGFGFLKFRDPKTVNVVMVKEHWLDGKIVRHLNILLDTPLGFAFPRLPAYNILRSIQNGQFPETNRNEQPKSSSEVSVKMQPKQISKNTSCNSAESSMLLS